MDTARALLVIFLLLVFACIADWLSRGPKKKTGIAYKIHETATTIGELITLLLGGLFTLFLVIVGIYFLFRLVMWIWAVVV